MEERKVENNKLNNLNFWENWENISPIEQKAIESIVKARSLVIYSVPEEVLVAIYIKGSFVRREMKESSDVDMVPIVKYSSDEGKVFRINDSDIFPVMAIPLSLEEFRSNQLATESDESIDLRARPDRFLRMINESRLIYGKPVNPKDYPMRADKEAFKDEIKIIKNGYIPLFQNGEIDFPPLLKEFFWMTEMELSSKGIELPHTFEGIAGGLKDDSLIQEALRLRQKGEISKTEEMAFIGRLKNQLETKN